MTRGMKKRDGEVFELCAFTIVCFHYNFFMLIRCVDFHLYDQIIHQLCVFCLHMLQIEISSQLNVCIQFTALVSIHTWIEICNANNSSTICLYKKKVFVIERIMLLNFIALFLLLFWLTISYDSFGLNLYHD